MDAAYDDQVYVDDRTIDSHIKRLRKSSGQASRVRYDETAMVWVIASRKYERADLFRASSGLLSQSSRRCGPTQK